MSLCMCSSCVPRYDDIREIVFKSINHAIYIGDILNIQLYELYDPSITPFSYVVLPFLLLDSEIVLGISYTGEKRFNPRDKDSLIKYLYRVKISKMLGETILTCGSIEPYYQIESITKLKMIVLSSPSLSYLHDGNMLCYNNASYIPLSDRIVMSVGIVFGRMSQRRELSLNTIDENDLKLMKMLQLSLNKKFPRIRDLRYPICRILNNTIDCKVRKNTVLIPEEIDRRIPAEGATGIYVLIQVRSDRFKPVVSNVIEIIDRNSKDDLSKTFILSHAALLSYTLNIVAGGNQSIFISNNIFSNILTQMLPQISRVMPHDYNINNKDFTSHLQAMEYVVLDRNGFYWLDYKIMRSFKTTIKSPYMLNLFSELKSIDFEFTARKLIAKSLRKGCYIVI